MSLTIVVVGETRPPIDADEVLVGKDAALMISKAASDWILLLYEGEIIDGEIASDLKGRVEGYECSVITHSNDFLAPGWVFKPMGVFTGVVISQSLRLFRKGVALSGTPSVTSPKSASFVIRKESETNLEESLAVAQKLAIEQYSNPVMHASVGVLLKALKRNAVSAFEKAVLLDRDSAKLQYLLGTAYLSSKDYALAQKAFHKTLKLHAKHSDALFGLGICATRLDDMYSAKEFFRQAVDANPMNITARNNLGVVLEKLDYYEDAIEQYEKSIALRPINPHAFFGMGVALVKKERITEAMDALRMAYKQGHPKQDVIKRMLRELSQTIPTEYEMGVGE